ncbi:3D domain-containing protein [Paenibacillus sp. FJAT-26967]|uniref:3D domain-containing protein n=1 Tax=Paenibacillus sp. FJAT-26967 TaxID=1729690 RepID=UPI0008398D86|nr:3D domain-containing protein [Paenibacillus sp. FJAT-26967]
MKFTHHWKKTCAVLVLGAIVTLSGVPTRAADAAKAESHLHWKLAKSLQEVAIPASLNSEVTYRDPSLLLSGTQTIILSESSSLWNLAAQVQMDVLDLLALNPEADPLDLPQGLKLKILNEINLHQLSDLKAEIVTPPVPAAKAAVDTVPKTAALQASKAIQKAAEPDKSAAKPVKKAAEKKPAAKKTPVKKSVPAKAAASSSRVVTTAAGKQIPYKNMLNIKASAYSADPSENGGYAGLDYFGNKLKVGTIAVDPKVIPLGTTVYVTGYSFDGLPAKGMIAKATDIGGAIKGNRIDIFVPGSKEKVNNFGYQNVKVYILK